MAERRFIERGDELCEWSLLVKGDDILAVRQIPHDGQVYLSTEDRPNRAGKQSEYQLDVEEVLERYAARSATETPVVDLLEDVRRAITTGQEAGTHD